ncbi:src kinase-associated phosphoprotein 1-like isoform X1 [Corticium candelabrum]|uniref:src kinase-associated phosphoprotein 1-like isoform X1 n=1 Tax=Corticium candelabrum TaxID=121492 RepID=UPI002E2F5F68|nr:src kinase-associated phosphoprotein 1-like isoform X1 [Corticium candelabrum]
MNVFVSEAKRVLSEVERFLAAIANKLPPSLDKERSSLLYKILEIKRKHQNDHPAQPRFPPELHNAAPPLPDRRGSSASQSSRSSSGPAVPPRPSSSMSETEVFQETYDVVDADVGFDKKAIAPREKSRSSSDQPSYLTTRHEGKMASVDADELYEPPGLPSAPNKHDELYLEADTHLDYDKNYHVMEQANWQTKSMESGGQLITDDVYTDMDESPCTPMPPTTKALTMKPKSVDKGSVKRKANTLTRGQVMLDSITNPDYTGKLKRKTTNIVVKWLEQTVVVKDNMIFIGDKDICGGVKEFFSLSGAVIESTKIGKQQHTFQIKPTLGKYVCFSAENAVEMQEWIRVLNRAASKSAAMTNSSKELDEDRVNETEPTDTLITEDLYEMPETDIGQQVQPPGKEPDKDEIFVGKFYPQDKRAEFQHIYKAQYDCMGEGDDEVTLRRGHLILIDFKDHNDWWVGTTQTPDGKFNGKRGFVPRAYLTPAFESL